MKKLAILIILFLLPFQAFATTAEITKKITFSANETRAINPLVFYPTDDMPILADKKITLTLDRNQHVLWQTVDKLSLYGNALASGKVNSAVTPTYSLDYKSLFFFVDQNLIEGDTFELSNLQIRAYDKYIKRGNIGVDIDEDGAIDFYIESAFEVDNDNKDKDKTAPYPCTNGQYLYQDGKILLTWENSPDYDVVASKIIRQIEKNGDTQTKILFQGGFLDGYYEDNLILEEGQVVRYMVYANDSKNESDPLIIEVNLTKSESNEGNSELIKDGERKPEESSLENLDKNEEVKEGVGLGQEEIDDLNRLYHYFKLRYQIKCLANDPTNDLCRWAKIDLVYAQEKTGRDDIDVILSDSEINTTGKRLQFSERRYETTCQAASQPADYCSALGKAIDRAQYFLGE